MRYVLVHKPYEVLTQFTDENGRATLKDFVDVPNVYPVGRLDYDSEGLVLLTDDKPLQHRLSEPRFKIPKTYWVQVEGIPTDEALEQLRRGVDIKTGFTSPAEAEMLPEPVAVAERSKPVRFRVNIPTSWLRITISQGMNRQVRKMTAAVGFPTLRLIRVQIADLRIAGLPPGKWRDLTAAEIKDLKELTAGQVLGPNDFKSGARQPGAGKSTGFWPGGIRPSGDSRKPAAGSKPSGGKFGFSKPDGSRGAGPKAGPGGKAAGSRPAGGKPVGGKPTGGKSGPAGKAGGAGGKAGAGRPARPR
ncbi:ribosomal large subunit pseudouridine synthase E [Hymenobacter daecheongensis DSM 21074]|uniref:Pseudouridine synthase n=1 Tax=Hymenobacter daecheongensis DSM 21074 TaxID=1121955 RepID=A0A1M6LZS1_9BACT|nr:pseudouridine synthase [Hymenobacter daecheongensis]SHJ76721.1 ribosomal large subunit pseudouridine synthase E [Hymenobacter daecheongensis DSM 21074]